MRAAIYCRISDDRTGEAAGVNRQETDCRKLCTERGWTVTAVHVDNDISASQYTKKRRPAYRAMLDQLRNGEIDAIVAWHTDRLYRRPTDLEDLIGYAEAGTVKVATCYGDFDLGQPDGQLAARILVAVAAKESADKSRRALRKHQALAEDGKLAGGGTRPYGYAADRRTIVPAEAAIIRAAAEQVLAGGTLRGVCVELDRQGHRTVTGAPWTTHVLRRILLAPRTAGKRGHRGQVVATAEWPAILAEGDWLRLRSLLLDPARFVAGNPRRYLLTGLAWCGLCGARLVARPRGDKRRCYVCASGPGFHGCGKIRTLAEPLEDYVGRIACGWADQPRLMAVAPGVEEVDDALAEVARLEARLAELAVDFYTERTVGKEQFVAASNALQGRINAAKAAAGRAVRRERATPSWAATGVAAGWDAATFDQQRALLEAWVEQVVLGPAVKGRNFFDPARVEVVQREG